ncbi:MAG: polysaccharide biosynthesis/export family protein [Terriglobia bacterium]
MVRKWVEVWERRTVAKASGLGIAVLLLTSLTSARAQQGTAPPALPPEAASKETTLPVAPSDALRMPSNEYVVSPEDLLDVYVLDVPEVTRTYRVSSNGFLTLPLLPEPIPAAGETLDRLSHLISTKFHDAGMLNNARVTVSVVETRRHSVLVSGEVKNPQTYPIFGPTRLLDVLVKAGGLTEGAGNDAIITRGEIGARADLAESARTGAVNPSTQGQSFTLNIRKLVVTGDDKTNILLYPGDRVMLQRAELIYILGAVNRPGGYVLDEARQHITVLKALAMAGDVSGLAKKKRITILRRDPAGPDEKRLEIPVDYKATVKGQIADVRLMADDILYVPESAGLKAWRTSINSAVSMATMGGTALMIYH